MTSLADRINCERLTDVSEWTCNRWRGYYKVFRVQLILLVLIYFIALIANILQTITEKGINNAFNSDRITIGTIRKSRKIKNTALAWISMLISFVGLGWYLVNEKLFSGGDFMDDYQIKMSIILVLYFLTVFSYFTDLTRYSFSKYPLNTKIIIKDMIDWNKYKVDELKTGSELYKRLNSLLEENAVGKLPKLKKREYPSYPDIFDTLSTTQISDFNKLFALYFLELRYELNHSYFPSFNKIEVPQDSYIYLTRKELVKTLVGDVALGRNGLYYIKIRGPFSGPNGGAPQFFNNYRLIDYLNLQFSIPGASAYYDTGGTVGTETKVCYMMVKDPYGIIKHFKVRIHNPVKTPDIVGSGINFGPSGDASLADAVHPVAIEGSEEGTPVTFTTAGGFSSVAKYLVNHLTWEESVQILENGEEALAFITPGSTLYFCNRIDLDPGIMTIHEFTASLNEKIEAYSFEANQGTKGNEKYRPLYFKVPDVREASICKDYAFSHIDLINDENARNTARTGLPVPTVSQNITAGTDGTTSGISPSTLTGSGTGMELSVTVFSNAVTDVTITTAGSGYKTGDKVTVTQASTSIPGALGDLVLKLAADEFATNTAVGSDWFVIDTPSQNFKVKPKIKNKSNSVNGYFTASEVADSLGDSYEYGDDYKLRTTALNANQKVGQATVTGASLKQDQTIWTDSQGGDWYFQKHKDDVTPLTDPLSATDGWGSIYIESSKTHPEPWSKPTITFEPITNSLKGSGLELNFYPGEITDGTSSSSTWTDQIRYYVYIKITSLTASSRQFSEILYKPTQDTPTPYEYDVVAEPGATAQASSSSRPAATVLSDSGVSLNTAAATIKIINPGTGYKPGDKIFITPAQFGAQGDTPVEGGYFVYTLKDTDFNTAGEGYIDLEPNAIEIDNNIILNETIDTIMLNLWKKNASIGNWNPDKIISKLERKKIRTIKSQQDVDLQDKQSTSQKDALTPSKISKRRTSLALSVLTIVTLAINLQHGVWYFKGYTNKNLIYMALSLCISLILVIYTYTMSFRNGILELQQQLKPDSLDEANAIALKNSLSYTLWDSFYWTLFVLGFHFISSLICNYYLPFKSIYNPRIIIYNIFVLIGFLTILFVNRASILVSNLNTMCVESSNISKSGDYMMNNFDCTKETRNSPTALSKSRFHTVSPSFSQRFFNKWKHFMGLNTDVDEYVVYHLINLLWILLIVKIKKRDDLTFTSTFRVKLGTFAQVNEDNVKGFMYILILLGLFSNNIKYLSLFFLNNGDIAPSQQELRIPEYFEKDPYISNYILAISTIIVSLISIVFVIKDTGMVFAFFNDINHSIYWISLMIAFLFAWRAKNYVTATYTKSYVKFHLDAGTQTITLTLPKTMKINPESQLNDVKMWILEGKDPQGIWKSNPPSINSVSIDKNKLRLDYTADKVFNEFNLRFKGKTKIPTIDIALSGDFRLVDTKAVAKTTIDDLSLAEQYDILRFAHPDVIANLFEENIIKADQDPLLWNVENVFEQLPTGNFYGRTNVEKLPINSKNFNLSAWRKLNIIKNDAESGKEHVNSDGTKRSYYIIKDSDINRSANMYWGRISWVPS